MPKKKTKNRKTILLNTKSLGNDISAYPFVEIKWFDIEGNAGYIKTKDKLTFDDIGNTTIIPTSVIQSIKKIH